MSMRYSDYTVEQLREEVEKLKAKAEKAEELGNISDVTINERKMQLAIAYMLNPDDFHPEDVHELKGDPGYKFKIHYINGVFAWGYRVNLLNQVQEKEEALPISLLGEKVDITQE